MDVRKWITDHIVMMMLSFFVKKDEFDGAARRLYVFGTMQLVLVKSDLSDWGDWTIKDRFLYFFVVCMTLLYY